MVYKGRDHEAPSDGSFRRKDAGVLLCVGAEVTHHAKEIQELCI